MRKHVNERRESVGCAPVTYKPNLLQAARVQARYLADNNVQPGADLHVGKNGSTPADRIKKAGYVGKYVGEVALIGSPDPDEAFDAMMEDESSVAVFDDCAFEHIGIFKVRGEAGTYWVLDFGSKAASDKAAPTSLTATLVLSPTLLSAVRGVAFAQEVPAKSADYFMERVFG